MHFKRVPWAHTSRWLLEQTPAPSRHGLLTAENTARGFRRNMLGMRWVGLAMAALAACAVLAALWVWGVSAARVKIAAFAYAERLILGCEALGPIGKPPETPASSRTAPTSSAPSVE